LRSRVAIVLLAAAFSALVFMLSSRVDPSAQEHTLRLRAGWTVSGYVQSDRGDAVAGARVCAVAAVGDATQQPTCTTSEASGAYALDLTDYKPITIAASAAGYALAHAHAGQAISARDASRADADIVLRGEGAKIDGRVVDALSRPVGDARVRVFHAVGALQSAVETRSDAQGKFELWAAPGGVTVSIEAPGHVSLRRWVVAPSRRVAWQLTPASSISGSVVDPTSGAPVVGVEVRASLDGRRVESAAAVSGKDGLFTIAGLEAGQYWVTAEHERFAAQAAVAVKLATAESQTALTIPLQSAVTVLGKVVSSQSDTCVGGRVRLLPSNISQPIASSPVAQVELDGSLRLRGLTPGHYRVIVFCTDQVLAEGPTELEIQEHDVQATWRVEPGPGLDITVLDAADQLVPNAPVVLRRSLFDQTEKHIVTPMAADETGHFITGTHLRPGKYCVRPNGGLQGDPVTVELHANAGVVQATLRLRGSAYIDVDLRDKRGEPVDGLRVTAQSTERSNDVVATLVGARAQGAGAYRIGPLEAGRYVLAAADGVNRSWSGATKKAPVELVDNASVRSKLVIARASRLSGQVVDAQGRPAANVWLNIKDEAAALDPRQVPRALRGAQRKLTDADGKFEIGGLSKRGRFVISVSDADRGEGAIHDVEPGTAVRLALAKPTPIASSAGDR